MTTINHTESFNTFKGYEQSGLADPTSIIEAPPVYAACPYSWHTDEELLKEIYEASSITPLMLELAHRFELEVLGSC